MKKILSLVLAILLLVSATCLVSCGGKTAATTGGADTTKAPSDPETHLRLAQAVLPFGKRTYIDKTFAPDLDTAKEIFAIAEKYNTPFFSSSALRYSDELAAFKDANNLIVTFGGSNFEEYIIHAVEMSVAVLKNPAKKVKVEHLGNHRLCNIVTENGSKAAIVYAKGQTYGMTADLADGTCSSQKMASPFFKNLTADILNFFETGNVSFDVQETLEVMRLRDALLKADATENIWTEV